MSNDLIFLPDQPMQLPAHLQGLTGGVTQALMAVVGDYRNRIGLKGSRFRQIVSGEEVGVWDENYLDVIIVGVVPTLSRLFYASKFKQGGDNAPPTCYSVDNITPAEDVISKQSDKCATCPQNIKGSRTSEDGHESKACSYFRRVVVILPGDPDRMLYVLDVKSMGLFGDSKPEKNMYSLNDYAKFLSNRNTDAAHLVTRLSFDTDQSVPKLLFRPLSYITEQDAFSVQELSGSDEVNDYLTISMKTVDISKEQAAEETEADVPEATDEVEQEAEPEAAPVQATPKPAVARPTPTPTKPVQAAAKPTQARPAPQQARPAPAQSAAKPAPAKPTPTPAKPAVARPAPVKVDSNVPAPAATAKPEPVEVADDEMKSILADLGL